MSNVYVEFVEGLPTGDRDRTDHGEDLYFLNFQVEGCIV